MLTSVVEYIYFRKSCTILLRELYISLSDKRRTSYGETFYLPHCRGIFIRHELGREKWFLIFPQRGRKHSFRMGYKPARAAYTRSVIWTNAISPTPVTEMQGLSEQPETHRGRITVHVCCPISFSICGGDRNLFVYLIYCISYCVSKGRRTLHFEEFQLNYWTPGFLSLFFLFFSITRGARNRKILTGADNRP